MAQGLNSDLVSERGHRRGQELIVGISSDHQHGLEVSELGKVYHI